MQEALRLSEHILLGDVIARRDGSLFYNKQANCGCALGRADVAAGGEGAPYSIYERWPWIRKNNPAGSREGWGESFDGWIGGMFKEDICRDKTMTIEQLVQQVREWEDEFDDALKPQAQVQVTEVQEEKKEEVTVA